MAGRTRVYASDAERQAAYRERKSSEYAEALREYYRAVEALREKWVREFDQASKVWFMTNSGQLVGCGLELGGVFLDAWSSTGNAARAEFLRRMEWEYRRRGQYPVEPVKPRL